MEGELIRLYIQGNSYQQDRALLSPTIDILNGYQESLNASLVVASKKFASEKFPKLHPQLSLTNVQPGSLDISTIVNVVAGATPLLPDMVKYSWELYKYSIKFIKVAVDFYNKNGESVKLEIKDSPGAVTFINNGNGNITVSSDVLEVAKASHLYLDNMAKQVQAGHADSIAISHKDDEESIDINNQNKYSFKVPSKRIVEPGLTPLKCGLYQFNKKSKKGLLDLVAEDTTRSIRFKVHDENLEAYIEALGATYSVAEVTREMKVNALGESTLLRLHIHKINNYFHPLTLNTTRI